MDPMTIGALIGAGTGILGGLQKDKAARQQMKLNAMQQRFAPLFGQAPGAAMGAPQNQALSSGLAGALGGFQTGANYQMMQAALKAAQKKKDPYQTAGAYIGNPADADEVYG